MMMGSHYPNFPLHLLTHSLSHSLTSSRLTHARAHTRARAHTHAHTYTHRMMSSTVHPEGEPVAAGRRSKSPSPKPDPNEPCDIQVDVVLCQCVSCQPMLTPYL